MTLLNKITSFAEVDRARFRLDTEHGATAAYILIASIEEIFKGKDTEKIAFQCECGRLGMLPGSAAEDDSCSKKTPNGRMLLCRHCAGYHVQWSGPVFATATVRNGLQEFFMLFEQAEKYNNLTLCYFLYNHLTLTQPQFFVVHEFCQTIFDMIVRNNLEHLLAKVRLGITSVSGEIHLRRQHILQLSLVSHVFETRGLYDILLSVLYIGNCEQFLIGLDGRSMHGAGWVINFGPEEKDSMKNRIALVKRELHRRKYHKLQRLVRLAFNNDLRNAFAHSQYEFREEGLFLSTPRRIIGFDKLEESFLASYSLQSALFDFIDRRRQEFIKNGGCEEAGWSITPIVTDEGFSVKVSGTVGRAPPRREPIRPVED